MSIDYPAFKSFSAGEISPRLAARSDMPMYHHALAKCENFVLSPQGSILKRRGWRYVSDTANVYTKLFTFTRKSGGDIVIALSDGVVTAFDQDQTYVVNVGADPSIPIPTEVELITNGDFSNGLTGWSFVSGLVRLNPQGLPTGIIGTNTYVSTSAITKPPNANPARDTIMSDMVYQYVTFPTGQLVDQRIFVNFTAEFDSSVWPPLLESSTPDTVCEGSWGFQMRTDADFPANGRSTQTPPSEIEYTGGITGVTGIPPFVPPAATGMFFGISAKQETADQNTIPQYYGIQFKDVSAKMFVYAPPPVGPTTPPWNDTQLKEIQFKMGFEGENAILTQWDHVPYRMSFDEDTNEFRLEPFYPIGTPDWDDTTGYPACAEIYQGRLWLSATKEQPTAIWGSTSKDHFSFVVGEGLAADGVYLPLATNGKIESMTGVSQNLYVLTDNSEHTVSSQGGIIFSGDANTESVSRYGSGGEVSKIIGDQVVFASPDTRKLLMANFDDSIKTWVANDSSLLAHHMLLEGFTEFHDVRNPNYQIALLTVADGWVQLVYDRSMGLLGWQTNVMNGDLVSMTVTKSGRGDVLWAVVNRDGEFQIIRMEPDFVEDVFLDYWVSPTIQTDANGYYISGLDHLEGLAVQAVVDDAVRPLGMVTGGVLRLQFGGTSAVVGLPYKAIAVTLPEEPADGSQSYSGGKRRNAEVTVRLYDSALPMINGKRPPDRNPETPMGDREPNLTQDVSVSSLGWSDWGEVTIEQDLPLNTEIVGIFTKIAVNRR